MFEKMPHFKQKGTMGASGCEMWASQSKKNLLQFALVHLRSYVYDVM